MTLFPNMFIIGAPKSGTTSLFEYLKAHPQVVMSQVKEPNYFAPDLADTGDNMLRHPVDEARYLDLFAAAGAALRRGEGSVRYIYSRAAPQLIQAVAPDPRIVVMLRNPVDMAHSLYRHMVAAGIEDLPTFEQALDAEEDRHRGRRIPARMNPRLSTYRDRARYGEQLPRWFETFGGERIHVIVFEDFIARPEPSFRALLEFLGVDADFRPAAFGAYNAAHRQRSTTLRRVLNSAPAQWLVWGAAPRIIGDRRTRQLVQRFRNSRLHRRPAERESISDGLRSRLEREFEPDVVALSRLLGRDMTLRWFGRPADVPLAPDRVGTA